MANVSGYLFALLAVCAWGIEYVLVKQASHTADPMTQGLVMFAVGGALLAITGKARRLRFRSLVEQWPLILAIGVIGSGCNLFWLWASHHTSAANMAILGRTDVLFSLLLGALVFGEQVGKRAWVWAPIMLVGIPLTMGLDPTKLKWGNRGDAMMLASAFLISLNAFLIKRCMGSVSGVLLAAANCTVNALLFLALMLITRSTGAPWSTVLLLVICGCCTYLFFVGYYAALKRLPVWEVRLLCLAVPVVAALVAWVWLKTVPTLEQVGGAALILGGAAGIILRGRRAPIPAGESNA